MKRPEHRQAAHPGELAEHTGGDGIRRLQSAAKLSGYRCDLVQILTSRGRLFLCLRGGDTFRGLSNLAISARSQISSRYWANRWFFRRRNSMSRLLANILLPKKLEKSASGD